MTPRLFSLRVALAPLRRRKSRALVSLTALALGATLVTALATLYAGVSSNLSQQFRSYGANLIATPPPASSTIGEAEAARALAAVPSGVGVFYDVAQAAGQNVVLAGADLPRLRALNPTWRWRPAQAAPAGVFLGVHAARALGLAPGQTLDIAIAGASAHWRIAGTVESGGPEDDQVFASYAPVAALAAASGFTTLQFHISGGAAALAAGQSRIAALLPGARLQPVRAIAAGEGAILLSTRRMLLLTSLLILLTVGLCVAAALTTIALQRRPHFGLMKALGGREPGIMGLFVAEAAFLGLAAAAVGMLAGSVLAAAMGRALFGLWLRPDLPALAAALALTVLLAVAAALLPWPVIRAAAPAAMLRGE